MSPTSEGPSGAGREAASSGPLASAERRQSTVGRALEGWASRFRWPAPRAAAGAALIAVVLVHGSLFWISHVPEPRQPFGDENLYLLKAERMAAGADWVPGIFWPLLQARFLAVIMRLGGGMLTIQLVQTLLLVATAVVVGRLARWLSGSLAAAWVAGLLILLDPQVAAFAHYLWPEVLHLLLFYAAWLLLLERPGRPAAVVGAGCLLGLALLTKNHLAAFVPVLVLPTLLHGSVRERALRAGLLVLALAGTLLGLNRLDGERLAPGEQAVSSALFNTWAGLSDTSRRNFVEEKVPDAIVVYRQSGDDAATRNRFLLRAIREQIAEKGVLGTLAGQLGRQPFRLLDRRSFLSDQLPGGAIIEARESGGYRHASPRIAGFLRAMSGGVYSLVLVGAMLGVATLPPAARRRFLWLAAFVAYNASLFLVIHVKTRFRIPLMPVLYVLTGVGVAWLGARCGWNDQERRLFDHPVTPPIAALAAVGAAALLVFAWAG